MNGYTFKGSNFAFFIFLWGAGWGGGGAGESAIVICPEKQAKVTLVNPLIKMAEIHGGLLLHL